MSEQADFKRQYGVQIVWADPVKAGAAKAGEIYTPRWDWFDSERQADWFARRFRQRIGDWYAAFGSAAARVVPEGVDPDEIWQEHDVIEVNRAERWAVEAYGQPEDVRPHLPAPSPAQPVPDTQKD